MLRPFALAFAPLAVLLTGGCAGTDASALAGARIPADRYVQTFQAAREVLRDYRYTADRIDAPQGVLTSLPRSEPGLAKPWEAKSGLAAAWEDLINYRERTVQIAFITGERAEGARVLPPSDPDRDLVDQPRETTLLVRVAVDRVQRPDRRVSADSVRVSRQAEDPAMTEKNAWPRFLVPTDDDTVLAADLLQAILTRSQAAKPSAPAQPATTAPQAEAAPAPASP